MPKNRLFFRKTCKYCWSVGGWAQTPVGFRQLGFCPRPQVIVRIYYCNFKILKFCWWNTKIYCP